MQNVYLFIKGYSDGGKEMKALLGGKGANLCEMARMDLPVPPGRVVILSQGMSHAAWLIPMFQ